MSSTASDVVIGSHLTPTSVATAGAVGSFVLLCKTHEECPKKGSRAIAKGSEMDAVALTL